MIEKDFLLSEDFATTVYLIISYLGVRRIRFFVVLIGASGGMSTEDMKLDTLWSRLNFCLLKSPLGQLRRIPRRIVSGD